MKTLISLLLILLTLQVSGQTAITKNGKAITAVYYTNDGGKPFIVLNTNIKK